MAGFHVMADARGMHVQPTVRHITTSDLWDALRLGAEDFWAKPSHYVFLCLIYPIVGLILTRWSSGSNAIQLVYPLMSGFALIGPFAAIGLYEISRRRELGMSSRWHHALDVRHSPALPSIAVIGGLLFALFLLWLFTAQTIYTSLFGAEPPASVGAFLRDVLTTSRGWTLILLGNAAGFVFAVVVLATTVIAFPLLLDRDVGAVSAIETSARAVMANPLQMALWGLTVAVLLVIGSIPLFAGLAVVVPVLGHATWHLYRKVIEPEPVRPVRRPM
ncbi:cytochrome C oxidase subunit I [Mesorhizobium loti]|uniref:Cytochrome C oxidase subunit I n=1 Tax=Rhizobium loti TaxID=381 RepID=A0A117N3Q0_RHILI|nr:cytochrome C oxidase subunit I [Mesorhizobium loti]